jgi:membrane protease YdiL (CAAX protease family)
LIGRDLAFTESGRLRAPWRLLLFLATALLCTVLVQSIVAPLLAMVAGWLGLRPRLYNWAYVLALVVAHALVLRWTYDDWAGVGLGAKARRPALFAEGAVIGVLAIGLPCVALLGVGWLRVEPAPAGSSLAAALQLLLFLAPAALWEELLFRGYAFTVIRERLGAPTALVVTSVAFAALHQGNPGANLQAVAQVAFAGVWLGGVLLATGSLYAAWMAHLAWNWTMAGAFHTAVSGLPVTVPDYRVVDAGPDWATGGAWGPEGGVGATVGMALALVYLYVRLVRRKESQG